jgi:hypothetical protein
MIIGSPYTKIQQSKDFVPNTGFDYEGQILRRTMSRQMFRTNATLGGFLEWVDAIVYELIESVKRIKTFANPALDKNDRRLN